MKHSIIVVDSKDNLPDIDITEGDKITIVLLTPDVRIESEIREQLPGKVDVDSISAAGHLERIGLAERDEYVSFTSSFYSEYFNDIISSSNIVGDPQLWWINTFSAQRSDSMSTFRRVCQLKFIRNEINEQNLDKAYIMTDDMRFWEILSDYFDENDIEIVTKSPSTKLTRLAKDIGLVSMNLTSYLVWIFRAVVQSALTTLLFSSLQYNESDSTDIVFHTVYPHLWTGDKSEDQKYRDVPESLIQNHGLSVVYAVSVMDGYHQTPSIREYVNMCRELTQISKNSEADFFILGSRIKTRDAIKFFSYLKYSIFYLTLSYTKKFSSNCQYGEFDITPLVRAEFLHAASTTPIYLTHIYRVEDLCSRLSLETFVTYLFEIAYGRATILGIRKASNMNRIIGVQHGPISKLKLMYYFDKDHHINNSKTSHRLLNEIPTPDYLITEGTGAKERLVEGGYDSSKIFVCGAPRVADIQNYSYNQNQRIGRTNKSETNLLVGFGLGEGKEIMSACETVLRKTNQYHLMFKPHPKSKIRPEDIHEWINEKNIDGNYSVETGSFYSALEQCDILVTTYSSVGIEGLISGYPVICLLLPNSLNPSPVLDITIPSLIVSNGGSNLISSIKNAGENKGIQIDKQIVEYFFADPPEGAVSAWAKQIADLNNK